MMLKQARRQSSVTGGGGAEKIFGGTDKIYPHLRE